MTSKLIDKIEIPATPLVSEGSWGARSLGKHASTMDLFKIEDGRYLIEWDIPRIEITEHIGIWTEKNELVDYDGVMSLPKEAVELLRKNGIIVPEDFE